MKHGALSRTPNRNERSRRADFANQSRRNTGGGIRPMRDLYGRIQSEIFIYDDDVPSGAGYARAIQDNLFGVTKLALDMGTICLNPVQPRL